MNPIDNHMKKYPKILPVIHYLDRVTALAEVDIARTWGADGVFLISHLGDDDELLNVAWEAKQMHKNFPIGINFLAKGAQAAAVAAIENGLDMVWADNMGVDSRGLNALGEDIKALKKTHPQIGFFASVAFKYQALEQVPGLAAKNALNAGFIPTTSGAGTGSAPDMRKIISMSQCVDGRLAVASGMTPENIAMFAPYLSHVLVSTGVSRDEYHLDIPRLTKLIINSQSESKSLVIPDKKIALN